MPALFCSSAQARLLARRRLAVDAIDAARRIAAAAQEEWSGYATQLTRGVAAVEALAALAQETRAASLEVEGRAREVRNAVALVAGGGDRSLAPRPR